MIFTPTHLKGSYVIELQEISDGRGWFARTYCNEIFKQQIGHDKEWVQMNHSFTANKGTVRGMHYQLPPHGEVKLIRCIAGAAYDVIIDVRNDSETFLQWYGTEISAANKKMIYIPEGFAHGFQTLQDNTELIYNHSAAYVPSSEAGIIYNAASVNIFWPLPVTEISLRDSKHPHTDSSDFKPYK